MTWVAGRSAKEWRPPRLITGQPGERDLSAHGAGLGYLADGEVVSSRA